MMKCRALFLSHGGGPLPLLGDEGHREMVDCLGRIASTILKPSAIVVVSAHWEENVPTITAGTAPSLIYDYYGFPPQSYEIRYPCMGHPALAGRIKTLLTAAGIEAALDDERGFDHGVFVPLAIMYPDADIPCVQVSLSNSLDPSLHIKLGAALRVLGEEDVLLIGSGFSFHNMRAFFSDVTRESEALNAAFESWLLETCGSPEISEEERADSLARWFDAPGARYCHPREEHLLPLLACYGMGQSPCAKSYELSIMGRKSSMYSW